MASQEKQAAYAALLVRTGVNVQPGQLLVLTASVEVAPFARLCAEAAYRAGAGQVQLIWTDETCERLDFEHQTTERLSQVPPWQVEQKRGLIEAGCCFLRLVSGTPGLLAHIDGGKLRAAGLARQTAFQPFQSYTMANHGQWSVAAAPAPGWAQRVFPGVPAQDATERLWDAIFDSVRVRDGSDPTGAWRRHMETLAANGARLNAYAFRSLHFQNGLGTDLTLDLVPGHVWAGGGARTDKGVDFCPNLPTEEVFCMPDKTGVNGTVAATRPLSYQGKLIEDFSLTFRAGKVVSHRAGSGGDVLENLLTVDEGSSYLGEVALVPCRSPISRTGLLFLNTLFDENASCHLALGNAYPENLRGGTEMDDEALAAAGANHSKEHCDFMFGSPDLSIEGVQPDGRRVPVFREGSFVEASGFLRE